jgi:SynChlorMet cassette protein ScmC
MSGPAGTEYSLKLANGQGWDIIADKDASQWMKTLASVMELRSSAGCKNFRKIRIRCNAGNDAHLPGKEAHDKWPSSPGNEWSSRDLQSIRIWSNSDSDNIICDLARITTTVESYIQMLNILEPIFSWNLDAGGLTLHSALVERDGKGAFLAAQGHTGKSTCCRRIPYPWRALCDDCALLVKSGPETYRAHPFPTWSDYIMNRRDGTWDVQSSVPASALFFISQSPHDAVIPIDKGEAAISIYWSAAQMLSSKVRSIRPDDLYHLKKQLLENSCEIARAIPAYRLKVSLDGKFWEEMENVMDQVLE